MPEEAAFLAALKTNPADDTTRLVYADWLDEHGEVLKAEYLRLVVARARQESKFAALAAARLVGVEVALAEEWRRSVGRGSH